MASLPKQIAQQIARIVKQTGEAVVKEPLEIVKTAGQQTGLTKKEEGVERPPGGGPSSQQVAKLQKKQQEDQKKLEFFRRRLRELAEETQKPHQPTPEEIEEYQKKMQAEETAKREKEKGSITAPGGPSKRGTALIGGKRKKGGSEMMPAKSR
ncbi:MAG TPA: hypothetical protein VMW41_03290 [Candidatus Bathyarchaeia archaeon]|nr:hypothetical protein [Candidatus Bathyarchaeia archaeon]